MSAPLAFFPLVSITWFALDALRHRLGKAWAAFAARRRWAARRQAKQAVAAAQQQRTPQWAAAFRAAAAHRHGRWD